MAHTRSQYSDTRRGDRPAPLPCRDADRCGSCRPRGPRVVSMSAAIIAAIICNPAPTARANSPRIRRGHFLHRHRHHIRHRWHRHLGPLPRSPRAPARPGGRLLVVLARSGHRHRCFVADRLRPCHPGRTQSGDRCLNRHAPRGEPSRPSECRQPTHTGEQPLPDGHRGPPQRPLTYGSMSLRPSGRVPPQRDGAVFHVKRRHHWPSSHPATDTPAPWSSHGSSRPISQHLHRLGLTHVKVRQAMLTTSHGAN